MTFKRGDPAPRTAWKPGHIPTDPGPDRIMATREQIALARKFAAANWNERAIGREVFDVSVPTFIRMKRDQPELAEAIAAGREDFHNMLSDALRKAASKGNIVAAMFLLKSRFGYREGEPTVELRPQVIVNLPGASTADAYVAPKALPKAQRVIDG